jgi:hypothetical protein
MRVLTHNLLAGHDFRAVHSSSVVHVRVPLTAAVGALGGVDAAVERQLQQALVTSSCLEQAASEAAPPK